MSPVPPSSTPLYSSAASDVYKRQVMFCAIQDLETTLANSDENSFLRTMSAAGEDRFFAWMLPNIYNETKGNTINTKPFPFQLGEVLPWWEETSQMQRHAKEQFAAEAD